MVFGEFPTGENIGKKKLGGERDGVSEFYVCKYKCECKSMIYMYIY